MLLYCVNFNNIDCENRLMSLINSAHLLAHIAKQAIKKA
ncbi:hypothetical protein GPAL_0809 [Glaciecola pallidula DSM 14239 = ACAM 615]|uniref:Uncharacterized protein n=1 Tax=Brumicola pallidula DSM 14239 = ACAM 615 TaxID=1121922 RepID=K6Y4H2_9ALTE|nr:hypothetical protein GPAL_0809 [Glaciecola pallidula DSM 14239 = ACAM 615]